MRIGIVLDESFDNPDGIQQYMQQVGAWLSAHGHTVYYLVGETKRTDIPGIHSLSRNVKVKFNGNWLSMPLPVSRKKLRAVLAELKLDVLHIQTPYSPFMAGRLMKLASQKTAVVGTFHILPYSWVASAGSVLLRLINLSSSGRFDEMMAVSAPARDFAAKRYGFACQVVPNTFDYARFASGKTTNHDKNIVFLGRLVQRKGSLHLLQAIAKLQHEDRLPAGWHVVLGGKGGLLAELELYVHTHGLADIVSFAGFVAEEDKADFLAKADIAVFPSVAGESFGISLIEAMAASRGVVIGGDNPGYRSVMEGFESQLIDPNDISTFADLLEYWMLHDAERTAQSRRQHHYVQRFDAEVVGPQIVEVYTKALHKRRKA